MGFRRGMDQYLLIISKAIGIVSFLVMIYGALVSVIAFISNEFRRITKTYDINKLNLIRQNFGFYLLLGLEFLIAADVIHTIYSSGTHNSWRNSNNKNSVSYFINLEIQNVQKLKS